MKHYNLKTIVHKHVRNYVIVSVKYWKNDKYDPY